MLHRILTAEVPRPRFLAPDLDGKLEAIVLKCLRRELGQRYPSAGALAGDLTRWLRTQSVPAPKKPVSRRAVMAGLAIAGVGGLTAWLLPGYLKDRKSPPEGGDSGPKGGGERENDKPPPRQWTLLEANGPTEAGELIVGKDDTKIGKHPDDGVFQLAVNPLRPALLRLCDAPPRNWSHFRIEAEVRHDEPATGAVGLFFAYRLYELAGVAQHCYARLSFTDSPGKPFDLKMHRLVKGIVSPENCSNPYYLDDSPEPRVFRKIAVVVGESEISLVLGDREVARTELRHLRHRVLDGLKTNFHEWPAIADGGIGLWVYGTRLSCRRFSIQPAT
jgi:hypothetical protein